MPTPAPHPPTRRALLFATVSVGLLAASPPTPARRRRVVTILGDSLTAGLGLPAADALPARLAAALAAIAVAVAVRGAGVSGDTTADGLARLDFSVQDDTSVCVVALGGNDLLRGVEPRVTGANLTRIVQRLKARHIGVILVGLTAPSAIGAAYARDFGRIFTEVARRQGVSVAPDLLAGVAGVAALNQADGLHPNAAGVRILAARLAPVVARALKAAR